MNIIHNNITNFFEEKLKDIKCQEDTRAYIVSIYGQNKSTDFDLSKDSVTLLYAQAQIKKDFSAYQNLGNWILFTGTIFPSHLNNASKDYYDTIALLSYYSCYKLINRRWPLFEELSDRFVTLELEIKNKLSDISL